MLQAYFFQKMSQRFRCKYLFDVLIVMITQTIQNENDNINF